MHNRSEEEVIKLFVNGWMTYFGPPDEVILDADGCFRGYRFKTLQAQCAVRIRYVPSDAHYQLGKAERHGQTVKYMVRALVSQFTPSTIAEMNLIVAMSTSAKNSLMRKSGSSPCQMVFGQNPKLPGALLSSGGGVETAQLMDDSPQAQQVEAVRKEAMMRYDAFEFDAALRRAMLRKARPYRGPFEQGQKVAYFRQHNTLDGEGSNEGYRQGIIIALDGPNSNLWVRNSRGRLVLCAREQCRPLLPGGEEEGWWHLADEDFRLLKNFEEDLRLKHALAFRNDAPPPDAAADGRVLAQQHEDDAADVAPLQPLQPLDGDGNPQPEPMLAPVLVVPPTPRQAPGTPRPSPSTPRALPATPTIVGRGKRTLRTLEENVPLLDEPAAEGNQPSGSPRDLPQEPSPAGPLEQTGLIQPAGSHHDLPQEPSSASCGTSEPQGQQSDQVTPMSSIPRHSSGGTGLTSDMSAILEEQYPELRGIKRTAATGPEELRGQESEQRSRTPMATSEAVPLGAVST